MNNSERKYVVYKHTSPDNKIYIGITGQNPPEKRWANGRGYTQNIYFNNEIIRYGWDNFTHEILHTNLTRLEAQQKETELIKYYNSTNKNFGYNISASGFGKVSEEMADRIVRYCDSKSATPVIQYTISGEYIRTFDNMFIAEKETGVCSSNIIKCCEQRLKSAGKYVWRYADSNLNIIDYNYKTNKQVIQYTKDGLFVCIYNSIIEADRKNNIDQSSITKCCKNKVQTAGGFIWRYASDVLDPTAPLFCFVSKAV